MSTSTTIPEPREQSAIAGSNAGHPRFRAYTLGNYLQIPQIARLTEDERRAIRVVGSVLPFRVNGYVIRELINWDDPNDPIFNLSFPRREMLRPAHYETMERALASGTASEIERTAN